MALPPNLLHLDRPAVKPVLMDGTQTDNNIRQELLWNTFPFRRLLRNKQDVAFVGGRSQHLGNARPARRGLAKCILLAYHRFQAFYCINDDQMAWFAVGWLIENRNQAVYESPIVAGTGRRQINKGNVADVFCSASPAVFRTDLDAFGQKTSQTLISTLAGVRSLSPEGNLLQTHVLQLALVVALSGFKWNAAQVRCIKREVIPNVFSHGKGQVC